jgi:hypothetical protein
MSPLMEMISQKRLHKVVGIAVQGEKGIVHVDEGQLYAAISNEDALEQATKFWTETMGFDIFTGHSKLIDRVDGLKVVLVDDEQA